MHMSVRDLWCIFLLTPLVGGWAIFVPLFSSWMVLCPGFPFRTTCGFEFKLIVCFSSHGILVHFIHSDCCRHCHYVIEAIIALAELGVPAKDIISLFPQVCWLYHYQVFSYHFGINLKSIMIYEDFKSALSHSLGKLERHKRATLLMFLVNSVVSAGKFQY